MAYRKNPLGRDELRQLALMRLEGQPRSFTDERALPEMQHLIEELEIHQIQLEMQNEHLSAARSQLELALGKSSEIYDFSPVGSLLLDPTGAITKLNLAAASLLQGSRSRLLGCRLGFYVAEEHRSQFSAVLERAAASGDVQGGEVSLSRNGLRPTPVYLRVASLPEGMGWQVILMDITERKLVEEKLRASEERLALALESVGDGVWDWNVQTGELALSARFSQLYGFGDGEYGRHVEHLVSRIHPDDKPQVMDALHGYLAGQIDSFSIEHRSQCKDGAWKWVLSRGAAVGHGADGRVLRMIGTHVDITCKKQSEEALRIASQFQQAVFDAVSAHLLVLDRQGHVIQTNAAWRQYARDHGCADVTAHIGVNYLELLMCLAGEDSQLFQSVLAGIASVASGELPHFQLPHPFYAAPSQSWFSMKVTPVHDEEQRLVVSHEDVSSIKAAELDSQTLANIDSLTGALSRRHFINLAEQELVRSRRYGLPLMLLMLDLDHFKTINDKFGHAAGDAILQGFVNTTKVVLRESDLLGRLGGEEFAVLLPNTTPEGGHALAQRIIESVRSSPVAFKDQRIAFTVSIGAASLADEASISALLGRADVALYHAKGRGRDRLEVGPA